MPEQKEAIIQPQPTNALKMLFGYGKGMQPRGQGELGFDSTTDNIKSSGMFGFYGNKMELATHRNQKYDEYNVMTDDDLPAAVLDLYAEDATQMDLLRKATVWIESDSPLIEELGEEVLRAIDIEEIIFPLTRNLAKYGDEFRAVLFEKGKEGRQIGVAGLKRYDPKAVTRVEDKYGRLQGFKVTGTTVQALPWDFIHFRLLGSESEMYGVSLLQHSRRPWRRLRMMEDSMAVGRIRDARDRLVWYINVGDVSLAEAFSSINRVRNWLRSKFFVDETTGEQKHELDPMSVEDEYWIPLRDDDDKTKIERLSGSEHIDKVYDIEYARRRLYGTWRIPGDYLGFTEPRATWTSDKSLAQQDIRYARICKRIQRPVIQGIVRLIMIDLSLKGINPFVSGNAFTVSMVPPSLLEMQAYLDALKTRIEVIQTLQQIGETLSIDKNVWANQIMKLSGLPRAFFIDTTGHESKLSEAKRKKLLEKAVTKMVERASMYISSHSSTELNITEEELPKLKGVLSELKERLEEQDGKEED